VGEIQDLRGLEAMIPELSLAKNYFRPYRIDTVGM